MSQSQQVPKSISSRPLQVENLHVSLLCVSGFILAGGRNKDNYSEGICGLSVIHRPFENFFYVNMSNQIRFPAYLLHLREASRHNVVPTESGAAVTIGPQRPYVLSNELMSGSE